jgi:hypothetical protein
MMQYAYRVVAMMLGQRWSFVSDVRGKGNIGLGVCKQERGKLVQREARAGSQ